MSRLRTTVTLPYVTALPEDVTMNTWHHLTDTSPPSAGELAEIHGNITSFYNSDFGVGGDPLSSYYSAQVSRAANACVIETFDLADATPRLAIFTSTFTLGAAGTPNMLPPEVALCASFQAAPISGVNQARRRGRFYIGPLNYNANVGATGRPVEALQTALVDAMVGMINLQVGSGTAWCVYSRVGDAMAQVANVWSDNAWDAQRRRGLQPTSRVAG